MRKNPQAGFSLVELMVAMVITLIITGAMYGLLTGGQSAFTTQPERTDRQQNMRAAMDIIMRDVASAGTAMPNFLQTFTPNLDGDANATLGSEVGPSGSKWDELEVIANTGGFGQQPVCHNPGKSPEVFMFAGATPIVADIPVLIFFDDGTWTMRYTVSADQNNNSAAGGCASSKTGHEHLDFNSGKDPSGMNLPGTLCQPNAFGAGNAGSGTKGCPTSPSSGPCCDVDYVTAGNIVHYKILDDGQGIPNLMRSEDGGPFQVLARGIEDMQVVYVTADGNTHPNGAPNVAPDNYATLITQVRVQLFARAINTRIQGAVTTTDTSITHAQGTALRGAMSAQASPRQALWALTQESPAPVTPRWN